MTLLLMAAGKGSRYGKLKQFDGLGPKEEFLMEFSISDALSSGFDHIVVVTQKDNVDFLHNYLAGRLPDSTRLDVVAQQLDDLPEGCGYEGEREKPWGTAHAVWSAREVIDGPFAVINADDYYGQQAFRNAAAFMSATEDPKAFGLVAYTLRDTLSPHGSVSRGVCKREGDQLVSVEERLKLVAEGTGVKDEDSGMEFTGEELVSMNFWICRPAIFSHIEADIRKFLQQSEDPSRGEVYLPFVIQDMLAKGEVYVKVIPSESQWFGITYADDKNKAVDLLRNMTALGNYRSPLWEMAQ